MDETEMDRHADAGRGTGERTMALQSTANAGTLLLLAAHAEGLGAVWNCAPLFAPEAVRTALDLPVHWEPQAMFLIGHAAIQPAARDRKPIEAVTIFR
jgi:nitroreductase